MEKKVKVLKVAKKLSRTTPNGKTLLVRRGFRNFGIAASRAARTPRPYNSGKETGVKG